MVRANASIGIPWWMTLLITVSGDQRGDVCSSVFSHQSDPFCLRDVDRDCDPRLVLKQRFESRMFVLSDVC